MTHAEREGHEALRRSLAVGVPPTGGWKETFLQYAGIPRVRLAGIEEGMNRGIRVFLWNRKDPFFDRTDGERIAVVTENGFLKRLFGLEGAEKEGYSFRVAGGGPFSERSFYVHTPCEVLAGLAAGPGACLDADGRPLANSGIILEERRNILFLSVPWNLLNGQMGTRWEFRPFYSPFIGKHFAETGPAVDFGALRRLFLELLLHAFRHVGLPLARLRHPFAGEPAFSFRVDADGFSGESTESVLRISERTGNATFSWFIDVQGWGRNLGRVRDLVARNQEVELHCYHHMTYRREAVNRANLKRGLRRLDRYGIRPKGVGSPYGFWFEGYQEAVRKLGCEYSSEFAFNVDDVPCFPYNRGDYPLQIPVHPGSVGVFEKVPFSPEEIFVHLRGAMDKAIRDCGCALLCDHPIGRIERYEEEFIELFGDLIRNGRRCIPISEYAERSRAFLFEEFHPVAVGRTLRIERAGSSGCVIEIIPPDGAALQVEGNRPFVVRPALEPVVDTYEAPPRARFERFLSEHGKDQTLTNLTLMQWYRGLAKHRLLLLRREAREFLRRVMGQ